MAVFMVNICKYSGCGLTFPGLGDLIQHIEDTHIDYDPQVVEQKEAAQPACIPLSYVLRFYTEAARQETSKKSPPLQPSIGTGMKLSLSSSSLNSSVQGSTPTGSDMEDMEEPRTDSEDSNDSWTTPEEFSSDFILSLAIKTRVPVTQKKNGQQGWASSNGKDNNNCEKPFSCPVPGCKKRYKNVNGIKYHSKNGHKKDGKIRKGFKCHCGKSYKSALGLKTHTTAFHNGTNLTTVTTPTGEILQVPTSQVTTLQPLRTLTVKQISASSLSSLGLPVKSIQSVVVATKPDDEKVFKIKLQPEKDRFIKVISAEEAEKIKITGMQALSTMQIKLPALKPTTIKLSSPHVLAALRNNITIGSLETKKIQIGEGLGILTPAPSPLTSPESKPPQTPQPALSPPEKPAPSPPPPPPPESNAEPMDTRPDT